MDERTQNQFNKSVDILSSFSDAKTESDRLFAAQSYAVQYLKYSAVYDSVVGQDPTAAIPKAGAAIKDKSAAVTRADKITKIANDLDKQVSPEITGAVECCRCPTTPRSN